MFGFGKKRGQEPEKPKHEEKGPLRAAIGSVLKVDTLNLQVALSGAEPSLTLPDISTFVVAGIGQSMLEADMQLTRYYDDRDNMIQVMGAPGCGPEDIVDMTVFVPWDSVVPASKSDWDYWTGPNGVLGDIRYDADGIVFDRFWGDGNGRMALVEFTETVEADGMERDLHQRTMLYARDLGHNTREMLLILTQRDLNARSQQHGASVEFMIGYGLGLDDVATV